MDELQGALDSAVSKISDRNYEHSLAFYRFWFDIGQTYHQIPPDPILDTICSWKKRVGVSIDLSRGDLTHPTAHLILRFARDVESDHTLAPHSSGLKSRLCTRILQEFFNRNLIVVRDKDANRWNVDAPQTFCADTSLIAHWANLGYVEEATIRNHILQSLISHPKLYDHQADALIILFKLAGATFGAHADPSVVDRCFDLLKDHYNNNWTKRRLVQVRAPRVVKAAIGLK
jgi:hypothetical protein